MPTKYLLGADCGTTAIKVALFDTDGNKVVAKAQEYALIRPSAVRTVSIPPVSRRLSMVYSVDSDSSMYGFRSLMIL